MTRLERLYRIDCSLDETQQYLRRCCLEITGVAITSHDNPKLLVKEIGTLVGAEIDDSHIAVVPRLPDSKNVKNRILSNFSKGTSKKKYTGNVNSFFGKNIRHLSSIQTEVVAIWRENMLGYPRTLSVPRSEQFSESEARGKL